MHLSWTLSRYIGKHFLLTIALVLLGLSTLLLLIDIIELIRRTADKDGTTLLLTVEMALLRMPYMAQKLLPFAVLIGSMLSLMRLTRSLELIVTRAAGVSVWQFLLPAVVVVGISAVLFIAVINPISAVMLLKYEKLEAKFIAGNPNLMAVSSSGLWLRQVEKTASGGSEHIIHAKRISQSDMSFSQVMILSFDANGAFTKRLDAKKAMLHQDILKLYQVMVSIPGKPTETLPHYELHTDLKMEQIQDSFASPETMPFWTLPSFINTLEAAGFSALKHKIYWHSLLASPLLLVGVVLLAAIFSLRLPRRGKIALLTFAGGAAGFGLHFMTNIVHALGGAGTLPIWLAAWTPSFIIVSLGTAALLHLEDG
jgi:lipopolysaccharide export system permease protein